jgi:hypothetical protein
MTILDDLSALRVKPFSDALAQLEALLLQGGRVFLIGAGCSKCAGLPLTAELTNNSLESDKLDATAKRILSTLRDLFSGATNSHIEDYLSELVDLLAIAERRVQRGASATEITLGQESYSAAELRTAANQIKQAISSAISKNVHIETHRAFVSAVHRPVRVGKTATSSVVDYLVLNYDTVLEDALALERIPFADGIEGGTTGWWSANTFDRDGLAARVLKLHGSVNWCEVAGDPLPRRIGPSLHGHAMEDRQVLIWPASTKYRETQLDPFAQLADRARRAIHPVRGSQRVLVVCGYSFGDAHINIEIDRALHESAGDLTVVAFTSEDSPSGKLLEWHEAPEVREQVLIFARHGFYHGSVAEATTHDLPWWKFENVVRLLRGER